MANANETSPVIDPTANVKDVLRAAVERIDDIRVIDAEHVREELVHIREILALRADYEKQLRLAESQRIDAIRTVDVAAVNRAAEVSATQAATLATQVATSAETLRGQVETARLQTSTALAAALEPIMADIRALRDAQSQFQGGRERTSENRLDIGQALVVVSVLVGVVGLIITMIVVFNK